MKIFFENLNCSSSSYDANKIKGNFIDHHIKQFIKYTKKKIRYNDLEDFDYELYDLNNRNNKTGFYVCDGKIYDDILDDHVKKDEVIRDNKIEELRSKYPNLYDTKKFRRKFITPLENRFIWDVNLYHQCIKNITNKSLFCNAEPIIKIHNYNDGWYFKTLFMNIYVDKNKYNIAEGIYVCHGDLKKPKKIKEFVQAAKEKKILNTINITNNKINIFTPNDFDTTKPTEDKKIKTLSKQSYTEHGITCENGVYNIKLFVDDIFENNISNLDKLNIKIESMWDEYMASDEEVDISYNKEDFFSINERKLRKKYQFKNIGFYIFHIDLTERLES